MKLAIHTTCLIINKLIKQFMCTPQIYKTKEKTHRFHFMKFSSKIFCLKTITFLKGQFQDFFTKSEVF